MAEEDHSPKEWQRFYMGYHERFVDDCVLDLKCGEIRLAQAPSARASQKQRSKGMALDKAADPALTGTTVWDGAVVLSHLLADTEEIQQFQPMWEAASAAAEANAAAVTAPVTAARATDFSHEGQESHVHNGQQGPGEANVIHAPSKGHLRQGGHMHLRLPRCIELGAGTGAVSLSLLAARRVSHCTITDLPDLLPHISHNVARNKHLVPSGWTTVKALKWGPEGEADLPGLGCTHFDLIVGSDLIYYTYSEETPHSKLLIWTLKRLASPTSVIYLALSLHHNPTEVEHFLELAAAAGFNVHRLSQEIPVEWRVHDVLVVRLTLQARP